MLRGRDFASSDTATALPVVIVNHSLARLYFPTVDPLGHRLAFGRPSPTTRWRTIVGVVADEKQDGLGAEVKPEVYDPHTQDTQSVMSIIVRTASIPTSVLPAIRREVAEVDRGVALYDIRTLDEVVARSLGEERFATLVLGGFAGTALLLAAFGLYGIVAFSVTERTREIGVRLALGASRAQVLSMIVWDGARVVLVGLAIGVGVALSLGRLVRSFLFQTRTTDPLVLVSVAVILALAGVLASIVPAYRAARVDPAMSLRAD
jgi:putative ABC transport system permease protein